MMVKQKISLAAPTRPTPVAFVKPKTGYPSEVNLLAGDESESDPVSSPGGGPPHWGEQPPPAPTEKLGTEHAIQNVVAGWRALNPAERKQVLALIALEAQRASPDREEGVDLWAEAVHEALEAAIGESDGAGHGPQVLRRLMGASAAWAPIKEFLVAARLTNLKRNEQYAVFRLLAKLLVARARRIADRADIPLTPKLVASNAVHIAGIFDGQFPGYVAAGLASVVARNLVRGNNTPD